MCVTHLLSYKLYWKDIDLYLINMIFYAIEFHDGVYNLNSLDNQNETQNTWITLLQSTLARICFTIAANLP